eukprot:CAMPEP_0183450282 /NCGR_PEP_ID=MMETSP0370-20130417/112235_1 /TAXON_ID=268820 /ORGANISM="Peridinium aciculiferum, Strain PAER-2" /LENGTH=47 /DNA_ID= /DNA_START= /DNA_END= /DNA_ORIENTATION=
MVTSNDVNQLPSIMSSGESGRVQVQWLQSFNCWSAGPLIAMPPPVVM